MHAVSVYSAKNCDPQEKGVHVFNTGINSSTIGLVKIYQSPSIQTSNLQFRLNYNFRAGLAEQV